MSVTRAALEGVLFGAGEGRRWTQDSPVLPDVWLAFGGDPVAVLDLLLTPHRSTRAGAVAAALRARLQRYRQGRTETGAPRPTSPGVVYTLSSVAAELRFEELVQVVLPMTPWWTSYVTDDDGRALSRLTDRAHRKAFVDAMGHPERGGQFADGSGVSPELAWMIRTVGAIAAPSQRAGSVPSVTRIVMAAARILAGVLPVKDGEAGLVWLVNRNRPAGPAVYRSALTVKADAARRLFEVSCAELAWAVIDSGIDATHPAFLRHADRAAEPVGEGADEREPFEQRPDGRWRDNTRVAATYDLTGVRTLLDPDTLDPENPGRLPERLRRRLEARGPEADVLRRQITDLARHLEAGRELDWSLAEPLLEIRHRTGEYAPPEHDHGTHVAGILASDWHREDPELPLIEGICPDLRLYDLRVLGADGSGDELSVISALQLIRHLNARHDYFVAHGVNLSLSIHHDVANFACGRTPVCDECERLAGAGVVVVAAAGNQGYRRYLTDAGAAESYQGISITDPGNAESAITVGATHRQRPHTYGVSYFSSRGPTGDGRVKPDLVAPGEKISAPVPGADLRRKDGTSMAAPHVSGAAAMLMARYNELVGQPQRIKSILTSTATDLGRERYFQGAGMLDLLRALQSV